MSRKAGILAAVYVAVLPINLDVTIVNVALPSIATELDADTRGLQWVVDGKAGPQSPPTPHPQPRAAP
jgi:hypothetical protein